jgi:2-dehydropantoate 2-reductase
MPVDDVWVVGAGAIGSIFAGALRPDLSRLLVDPWPERVESVRRDGLRIENEGRSTEASIPIVHTAELASLGRSPSVVMLAVKAPETGPALATLLPHMSDSTAIVSLQNGVNEDAIAEIVGAERTIGAVVQYGGEMAGPGEVRAYTLEGGIQVGELDGALTPRLESIASLVRGEPHVEPTDDIWSALWSKLMVNVQVNALAGLTGFATDELAADPKLRRIALALAREAVSVALALEVSLDLELLDGEPSVYLESADDGAALEALEAGFVRRWSELSVKPSLLHDIERGRPTEIEALNGYVAKTGRGLGVSVAVNEAVVGLVRAQHDRGPDWEESRRELVAVYEELVAG